jgi:hypothetical protein
MKTLRIILLVFLAIYGLAALAGTMLNLFSQAKMAELQQLGQMSAGIEKLMILSGALMLGQVWLYFSAIMLLSKNMKEGYMYAVSLGFIEFFQAIVIVTGFATHGFGHATDYVALLKGLLLLSLALVAFKKSQAPATQAH